MLIRLCYPARTCLGDVAALPSSISALTKLESLNVFNNDITGLPVQITQLPNLRTLVACINKIKELPRGFGSCPALVFLDVSGNELTSLSTNFFYLSTLSLSLSPCPRRRLPVLHLV